MAFQKILFGSNVINKQKICRIIVLKLKLTLIKFSFEYMM